MIGAKFKKFETQKDAEEFVRNGPKVYTKPALKSTSSASSSSTARPSPYTAAAAARKAQASGAQSSASSAQGGAGSGALGNNIKLGGLKVSSSASSSDTMIIYTDGSSLGNGKVGSQAGLGVFFGVNDPRNVSERLGGEPQTNQRAELMVRLSHRRRPWLQSLDVPVLHIFYRHPDSY